jgi:hypothetical protein
LSRLHLALLRPALLVLPSNNRFVRLILQQAAAKVIAGEGCNLFGFEAKFNIVADVFRQSSARNGRQSYPWKLQSLGWVVPLYARCLLALFGSFDSLDSFQLFELGCYSRVGG